MCDAKCTVKVIDQSAWNEKERVERISMPSLSPLINFPIERRHSVMAMFIQTLSAAAVISSAALLATTQAHQTLLLPVPTYADGITSSTKYNPIAFLEDQGFTCTDDFNAYLTKKSYSSLRAFMDDSSAYKVSADYANFECGNTLLDGTVQTIPTTGTMRSTGYTHDGPCEAWLDDTKVLSGTNCHDSISGKTYDFDYSSCGDSCVLRWYWMGVRYVKNEYSWQVYKACVPLASSRRLAANSTSAY